MGSVFGGGGGGNSVQPVGQQVVQQKSEPWEGQKPYLNDVFIRSEQMANKPIEYYPGSTVTPFSGQTETALQAAEQRALAGSPIQDMGREQMYNTLSGGYLNANPHLDAMYNRAARPVSENFRDAVSPGIAGGAAKAGRYGSGLYQDMQSKAQDNLGRTLGEMGTDIYGRAYESERGRMNDAIMAAPQYAQSDYSDIAQLANVGSQRESLANSYLQDAIQRWNFQQNEPMARLGNYASMVQGDYGRTSTTSTPIYRQQQASPFSQVLQGGLTGGLLAKSFGLF